MKLSKRPGFLTRAFFNFTDLLNGMFTKGWHGCGQD